MVWLGAITPLLCVPGHSSDHHHGPHFVFDGGSPILGEMNPLSPLLDRMGYSTGHPHAGTEGPPLSIVGLLPLLIFLVFANNRFWRWQPSPLEASIFVPPRHWRPPCLLEVLRSGQTQTLL